MLNQQLKQGCFCLSLISRPYLVRSLLWYSFASVVCLSPVTLCIVAKRCVLRYDTIEEINVDSKAEYTA